MHSFPYILKCPTGTDVFLPRLVDLVLLAGVDIMHGPKALKLRSIARMLSRDGHCHTFDAAANGYARGEGCGAVVLKRLLDAQRDGDQILAVIRGAGVTEKANEFGLYLV